MLECLILVRIGNECYTVITVEFVSNQRNEFNGPFTHIAQRDFEQLLRLCKVGTGIVRHRICLETYRYIEVCKRHILVGPKVECLVCHNNPLGPVLGVGRYNACTIRIYESKIQMIGICQ